MRRWIVYTLVLAMALFLSPAEKTDVGDLLPVELLHIYYSNEGTVCVETDTGDFGTGETLDRALSDLKATASGNIFLDTADYLVIAREAIPLLPRLWEILRPATQVCLGTGADPETARFLSAHKPGVTLNAIRAGMEALPVLTQAEGRYRLEYKSGFYPSE